MIGERGHNQMDTRPMMGERGPIVGAKLVFALYCLGPHCARSVQFSFILWA